MIREMLKKDIDNIVRLEESSFNHSLGSEFLERAYYSDIAYVYVYEENKNIIGYISSIFDGEIVEILNFCVDKEKRRLGIGTNLISKLLNDLKAKGAKTSILEVRESNLAALNCYKKLGYNKINVRKAYYSDGEDAYVLEKVL